MVEGFYFGVGFAIAFLALYAVALGVWTLAVAFGAWLEGWSYRRRQLAREREREREELERWP